MKYTIRLLLSILGAIFASRAFAQSTDTLTLAEAVRMAVTTSPAAQAAAASLDASKARIKEIDSYIYPQLNADANYTRIDPVVTIDFPINGHTESFSTMPNDNYNGNLNVQQLITAFGRERANERVAESGVRSAQDNLQLSQSMVAYQTVQAYYSLLSTEEGLRVEESQLKVLQDNLKIAKERLQQGTVTALDTLNISVRISTVQSQISDLNSTRAKQEAALRRVTGYPVGQHITVARPAQSTLLPEQEDTLETLAELHRSEIQVARDAENTARLQVEAARLTNNPTLSANVSGGVKDGYLPNLTQPKLNWAGTVGFHWPLFDGGRVSSQVDQAEANYRAAQGRTQDAIRGVRSDIEQALADIQASRSRLGLTTSQIEQAQQAYDIALVRYRNGAATNLDVLTAEQQVEQANLQRAQLMYSYELSQYNLNRAVGTTIW